MIKFWMNHKRPQSPQIKTLKGDYIIILSKLVEDVIKNEYTYTYCTFIYYTNVKINRDFLNIGWNFNLKRKTLSKFQ